MKPASDLRLLFAAAFVRALATGMIGVLLGVYLAALDLSPAAIGGVVSAGLAGAALATLAVTLWADRAGHRRALLAVCLLACVVPTIRALRVEPTEALRAE